MGLRVCHNFVGHTKQSTSAGSPPLCTCAARPTDTQRSHRRAGPTHATAIVTAKWRTDLGPRGGVERRSPRPQPGSTLSRTSREMTLRRNGLWQRLSSSLSTDADTGRAPPSENSSSISSPRHAACPHHCPATGMSWNDDVQWAAFADMSRSNGGAADTSASTEKSPAASGSDHDSANDHGRCISEKPSRSELSMKHRLPGQAPLGRRTNSVVRTHRSTAKR
ncbi:hypothetical protein SRABI98_00027 [Microbacterium sp. Bi98]|nr:hypothetical protein SRABI98_00027 [Microbacterium sp. Bi98]